jgi:hypothetical protein
VSGPNLEDLEYARDECRDAIMDTLAVAAVELQSPNERLMRVVYTLGSIHATIEQAIEAAGEPAKETSNG